MDLQGYWKFHRKMLSSKVWSLPIAQRIVWITILNYANHQEKDWWNGTEFVKIPAGSFVTSQDHLAELSGTSRQIVRDAISALISSESITTNIRTKSYTQINVTNWHSYQGSSIDENQEKNQVRTKSEPSENHNGRMKEGKTKNLVVGEPTTNGNHPIKRLLAIYDQTYLDVHKTRPIITGKDAKVASAILKNRTFEEAAWLVEEHLRRPIDYYAEQRLWGMEHVAKAANRLLARKHNRLELRP